MRINSQYVSPKKLDYYQSLDHDGVKPTIVGYNTERPTRPNYKGKAPIKFGNPMDVEFQKKELIKELVIDPEKREKAMMAAALEKQSGTKEKPITTALIKTTQAHQSAMTATSIKEAQAIAEDAAEKVVKEEKQMTFQKVVKSPIAMLLIGILIAVIVIKLLK